MSFDFETCMREYLPDVLNEKEFKQKVKVGDTIWEIQSWKGQGFTGVMEFQVFEIYPEEDRNSSFYGNLRVRYGANRYNSSYVADMINRYHGIFFTKDRAEKVLAYRQDLWLNDESFRAFLNIKEPIEYEVEEMLKALQKRNNLRGPYA